MDRPGVRAVQLPKQVGALWRNGGRWSGRNAEISSEAFVVDVSGAEAHTDTTGLETDAIVTYPHPDGGTVTSGDGSLRRLMGTQSTW